MSLALAARFARREMRGGLRGFRLFLACLALGVAAIAAVGSVRSAIEAGLAREGASLLGGAAELDFTYRFASEEERAWMQTGANAVSEIVEFRSMAVVGTDRALTQIKAVDDAYPLVGTVTLSPDIPLDAALSVQNGVAGAVMERALSDRLGLSTGDVFQLGVKTFTLTAVLTREPDSAATGFALGPRTLLKREALNGSGLLAPGTLFNSKYRLDLPPDADLAALQADAEKQFENAGMRWTDARNGAPGVAQFVDRLSAFLVLVGLSGLAVGGVGVSAAVRAYLQSKTGVIATLRALGASRATIFQTYFIQIGALSILGIVIGLTLGAFVPLLLSPVIEARLPIPASFALYPAPLIEAALYGLLTALAFTLWPLARSEDVRAATLFRDAWAGAKKLPAARYLIIIAIVHCDPHRFGGLVQRFMVVDPLDTWWHRRCLADPRASSWSYACYFPPPRACCARSSPPALDPRCNFRSGRGCWRCRPVFRARSLGPSSSGPDRRKSAKRDFGQSPRRCAFILLCRYPKGPDVRLHRTSNDGPRCYPRRQRSDAAGCHNPDQQCPCARNSG